MNVLRNVKSFQESLSALTNGTFSSKIFVKQFCQDLEQNSKNLFFNEEVQNVLKHLTQIDYNIIFRPKKLGKRLKTPEMKFMTDEQLEKAKEESAKLARKKLQMPPVLPPRKEINHVFVKDEKLKGYTQSKYIFTDISYGKNDRDRYIVVRDIDGTLRKATWEERENSNNMYFSIPGRKIRTPLMFKPGYFEDVLEKGWFEFILDRACLQFEPDDPLYVSVTQATYDKIAETKRFRDFESTRHFGSMIYYFAEQKKLGPLLIYYMDCDRLNDIMMLIKLHSLLHPEQFSSQSHSPGQEFLLLKDFIAKCYPDNPELELALKSYEDYISRPKSQAVV